MKKNIILKSFFVVTALTLIINNAYADKVHKKLKGAGGGIGFCYYSPTPPIPGSQMILNINRIGDHCLHTLPDATATISVTQVGLNCSSYSNFEFDNGIFDGCRFSSAYLLYNVQESSPGSTGYNASVDIYETNGDTLELNHDGFPSSNDASICNSKGLCGSSTSVDCYHDNSCNNATVILNTPK